MKLYSYWRSTAAYRARIALNIKGLEVDIESVNLLQAPDSATALQYRQVNPQGLVPALVDNGSVIVQSTAIIEYLEEQYPAPALLPENPISRAIVRSLCQIVACDIHPMNNLRVLQYLRGDLSAGEPEVDAWYAHWVELGFGALETQAKQHRGRFCFGDEVTMADLYLAPQMYNARRFNCDLAAFPNLLDIDKTLTSLDAFVRAAPEQQPDAPVR